MYRVNCISCGRPFDALKAPECSCLQPVRSYRCPNCAACFCKDEKKLDEFWRNAPQEMWQRRRTQTAPESTTSAELKRPLVLFADDDATGRAIAARVIASLGYGVITASNGEEALGLAREHHPELIITDALMPRLDGREMARTIKFELPETKIVVITSVYKDARYKHEAMRDFQVDEYLPKPVDPKALREVLTKYLTSAGRS